MNVPRRAADRVQTGSRQPQGTSSVSGAREGRAQLDASRLHHAAAGILVSLPLLLFSEQSALQKLPAAQLRVSKLLI